MKRLKLNGWTILSGILAVLWILSVDTCSSNKETIEDIGKVINYKHDVKKYTAKDGTLVNYNTALKTQLSVLEATNDSLVGYIENLGVKNPETITIVDTRFSIDTVFIPFDKPIDSCEFVRNFQFDTTHYSIKGIVTDKYLTIDRLSIPNRIGVVTAYKKTGFLRKEMVVTVTNSNPMVSVEGISSFTFKEKKKWWQKGWPKIVVGAAIGGFVVYQIKK